jgi:hypothetical protein
MMTAREPSRYDITYTEDRRDPRSAVERLPWSTSVTAGMDLRVGGRHLAFTSTVPGHVAHESVVSRDLWTAKDVQACVKHRIPRARHGNWNRSHRPFLLAISSAQRQLIFSAL